MLDFIRKKQKSVIIKVAFGIIILSFVIGYAMLSSPGGPDGSDPTLAATVNGTRIGFDEYQSAYSNLYRLYQDIYREKFTPAMEKQLGLRQQAMDALVDQTLLLQEAESLGLEVSRGELVDAIAEIPAFQENGTFSRDRYLQVLNQQRLSPDLFEVMQRRQLLVEKVQEKIQEGITVTDEEIVQEYRDSTEKINLAFVRLTPSQFEGKVKIDRPALEEYFTGRQEDFRLPEEVSLRYIIFPPDRYLDQVTFDQAELEKYYRRHLDRFERPELAAGETGTGAKPFDEVKGEVETGLRAEKAWQLAYEKAMDAYNMNRQGGSLEKAAEANGLAIQETGLFDRQGSAEGPGQSPEVVAAAFGLQPSELGRPARLPQGVVLFAVKEKRQSRIPALAEVRDEVELAYRREQGRDMARQAAEQILAGVKGGKKLDELARAQGARVEETGPFTRAYGSFIPRLGSSEEMAKAAFGLTRQSPVADRVYEQDGRYVVALLKDRETADMTLLDEAKRKEIRESLLAKEKSQAVESRLQELRSKAEITIEPAIATNLEGEKTS